MCKIFLILIKLLNFNNICNSKRETELLLLEFACELGFEKCISKSKIVLKKWMEKNDQNM
jgi:hypothetical protein